MQILSTIPERSVLPPSSLNKDDGAIRAQYSSENSVESEERVARTQTDKEERICKLSLLHRDEGNTDLIRDNKE